MVSPVIVQGDAVQLVVDTEAPPAVGVAMMLYARIGDPPSSSGIANAKVAAPAPPELERIRGADGTPAVITKVRVTASAGAYVASPACCAAIVQLPVAINCTMPPDVTVH